MKKLLLLCFFTLLFLSLSSCPLHQTNFKVTYSLTSSQFTSVDSITYSNEFSGTTTIENVALPWNYSFQKTDECVDAYLLGYILPEHNIAGGTLILTISVSPGHDSDNIYKSYYSTANSRISFEESMISGPIPW